MLEKWLPREAAGATGPAAGAAELPSPTFDEAGFMERMLGDKALACEIIRSFLADVPQQIQALKVALQAADPVSTVRHAHTVKGVAATVNAEALRAVAAAMEQAAHAGDLAAVAARLPQLETEFASLQVTLLAFSPVL